jgi:metal-dependent amidase/aminoacylase/carboxypeptidase family protein
VFDVEYIGKAAHQGSSPEQGLNALDAIVTAYNGVSQLRQHIRPDARLGAIITHGGDAVNIIPERTAGIFSARAGTMAYLEELRERLRQCLQAGAHATGCEARITLRERQYAPLKSNRALGDAYIGNGTALGMQFIDLTGVQTGGTDMGNVSQALPSIQPEFSIGQAGNHTREFTAAAVTAEAHAAMLRAARALAMTAIDVALAPGLLAQIKREFMADGNGRER